MHEALTLYDSIGPNPQVVRMFAAEKGIELDLVPVDIVAGECRREPYLTINPMGTTPALKLASGEILTEIVAICEYLEELQPDPVLIGATPTERAETRMWVRRIDINFVDPLVLAFRAVEGRALFEERVRLVRAEAAVDLRAIAFDMLDRLAASSDERSFICGNRFTLADILLFSFVGFAEAVGMMPLEQRPWLAGWFARVAARPRKQEGVAG